MAEVPATQEHLPAGREMHRVIDVLRENSLLTASQIEWVAHRGDPFRFPENSLAGYHSAITAGAKYIETDVHLTADEVPVLSHDDSLDRVAGIDASLFDLTYQQLQQIPACCPERFGGRFKTTRIASLDQFVELLNNYPHVTAFIEIKRKSLYHFGRERCLQAVMQRITPVLSRVSIISFDLQLITDVMRDHALRGGWVLLQWDGQSRKQAMTLSPDYLFIDIDKLPPGHHVIWPGSWQWVLYNIDDAATRDHYLSRGFHFFETNHIAKMQQ
jgi:glycerophosphoryl diester phosphodiesterase